jgi:hypothetical protein
MRGGIGVAEVLRWGNNIIYCGPGKRWVKKAARETSKLVCFMFNHFNNGPRRSLYCKHRSGGGGNYGCIRGRKNRIDQCQDDFLGEVWSESLYI